MDYLVAIDGKSPVGALLLSLKGRIGGATTHLEAGAVSHPVIIASDPDWTMLPAFVRMTHIRNPGTADLQPRELVVPSSAVLLVMPVEPAPNQQPAEQEKPSTPLH